MTAGRLVLITLAVFLTVLEWLWDHYGRSY